jgi:hypothetical protein
MTSEELKRDLEDKEQKLAALRIHLNSLVVTSRPEMSSMAGQWMDKEVTSKINEHHAVITGMGAEARSAMKAKIAAVKGAVDAVVEKHSSKADKYPHNSPETIPDHGSRYEEPFFPSVFRNAISTLGPVLHEYGLLPRPQGNSVSDWKVVADGRVHYSINPLFTPTTPTLVEYDKRYKEYRALEKIVAKKRVELEKATARELYDAS